MPRNVELENRVIGFAARCIKVCEALPAKRLGSATLSDQLFRSSTSVAANYAEASQAESRKDFVHKLKIVLKELTESRTWLRIIAEAEYLPETALVPLAEESDELIRLFSSSVITARKGL